MRRRDKLPLEPSAEAYISGPIKGRTRTALLRSLTKLLEAGDPASYEERLRALDLKIAEADRKRRDLIRARARVEGELSQLDGLLNGGINALPDVSLQQFSQERDRVKGRLEEINLTLAQLDRDKRKFKKERKAIESALGY